MARTPSRFSLEILTTYIRKAFIGDGIKIIRANKDYTKEPLRALFN